MTCDYNQGESCKHMFTFLLFCEKKVEKGIYSLDEQKTQNGKERQIGKF